jgi:Sec-independent protein translocase protein TatA
MMGAELMIGLALAFVVLGPKRMRLMLGHAGRAKARLDTATEGMKTQWAEQLNAANNRAHSGIGEGDSSTPI